MYQAHTRTAQQAVNLRQRQERKQLLYKSTSTLYTLSTPPQGHRRKDGRNPTSSACISEVWHPSGMLPALSAATSACTCSSIATARPLQNSATLVCTQRRHVEQADRKAMQSAVNLQAGMQQSCCLHEYHMKLIV